MPSKSNKKARRDWLELPSDSTLNILQRISMIEILQNVQKVCTGWREICKDPAMWRVVYMNNCAHDPLERVVRQEMCKNAVDRSLGQLADLTIIRFCDHELLQYIADRSSQLRRLEIILWYREMSGIWDEAFKKFSLLEELSLISTQITQGNIEAMGRFCPLIRTLKVNKSTFVFRDGNKGDEVALAIGKNLPHLTHLELIINNMTNTGLVAILDGCCHLESLDVSRCLHLDLNMDLWKQMFTTD